MLLKKIIQRLTCYEKKLLKKICNSNDLLLDYVQNKSGFLILKEIFEDRVYVDYFPFHKKAVIVDVGAHFGFFSLFANRNTHRDSRIFSFEASKENFLKLQKNISRNKIENVRMFQCAIGSKNGKSKLFHRGNPANSALEEVMQHPSSSFEEIETKTLERAIKENGMTAIDFLKIDCEGSEYTILETLSDETFSVIKTISLEFHDLKSEKYTSEFILNILNRHQFKIVKHTYDKSTMGLNYGKIIATK